MIKFEKESQKSKMIIINGSAKTFIIKLTNQKRIFVFGFNPLSLNIFGVKKKS